MWRDLDFTLYETAANALEALGFMFTGLVSTQEQLEAEANLSAEVKFDGPIHGTVHVTLCGGVLKQLTSNMLGEDEDTPPSDEDQRDALGELANVICGNLLPHIGGTEAVFDVGSPVVLLHNDLKNGEAKPAAQTEVGLDRGRADIAVYIADRLTVAINRPGESAGP